MIFPHKLKKDDGVRVVTPARSLAMKWINDELKRIAIKRFEDLDLSLSFGKHVNEIDEFKSSTIKSRVQDLHDAFEDPSIKMIISVIGGFSSNQILPFLDYKMIKSNPKIICGYSDITALENAVYTKTGLVTYSGPHFFNFGSKKGFEYTSEYFKKCLFSNDPFEVQPSKEWSNDKWANNQENRRFEKNEGFFVINEGKAEGKIVGSNLVTFQHLAGTPYMPSLRNTILFIEDDEEEKAHHFDSNLTALSLIPDFSEVKGVVIGRFQHESNMKRQTLTKIIKNNRIFDDIPVIGGVDFGHTEPRITFPIGGTCKVLAENNKVKLEILKH